jgi:hypothetical protein
VENWKIFSLLQSDEVFSSCDRLLVLLLGLEPDLSATSLSGSSLYLGPEVLASLQPGTETWLAKL